MSSNDHHALDEAKAEVAEAEAFETSHPPEVPLGVTATTGPGRSPLATLALAGAMLALSVGCSSAPAPAPSPSGAADSGPVQPKVNRLVWGIKAPPAEAANIRTICCFDSWQYRPSHEDLVGMDPNTGQYIPGLATHWKISPDKMTYWFRIDPPRRITDVVIDSSSFNKARGDGYVLAVTLRSRDERSHVGGRCEWIADTDFACQFGNSRSQTIVDALLRVDAGRRGAVLPCVDKCTDHRATRRNLEITEPLRGAEGQSPTLFSLLIGQLAGRIGYEPLFACLTVFELVALLVVWLMLGERRRARPLPDGVAAH